ncbi:MAG TPA: right-handed parallel beta-helix repeat-containing protein [Thermoanaerobaculia bacterium]
MFVSLLLFPLFATVAVAQTTAADVTVAIIADSTADASRGLSWKVDVINNGPGVARNVAVSVSTEPQVSTVCNVRTIDLIPEDSHQIVDCTTAGLGATGDVVLHALVASDNDPQPANNEATKTVHMIAGGADLGLAFIVPTIDPALPFEISGAVYNTGAIPATGVTITLTIPAHVQVTSLAANCTQSSQVVTCSIPDIPANTGYTGQKNFSITAVADDSTNGQTIPISADIHTTAPEGNVANNHLRAGVRVFRTFYVTQTGADELAAAIDEANANCTDDYPCKIAFRLGTPPASGYFTLKPQRALPKITGKNVSIDGTTQTRLTGDTNPNGPEVFIDGSNSSWEDAIAIDEPCALEVAGLAIGNFTNAAVTIAGEIPADFLLPCQSSGFTRTVHDNYLGVDPSGTQPAPNGRGVVINEHLFLNLAAKITNNVISANHHSGVWIGRANGDSISGNRIGLDIHNEPLGNSAGGIYVSPSASDVDIRGNYVAFNHYSGIAVDRSAIGTDIGPNSIFANWQLGIDVGLDGPTPDRDVAAPVVISAQYDPATNTTVLTIASNEPPNILLPTLNMYASDAPHPSGYGDGQYYLGSLRFNSQGGNVRFAALGDWRGKWVSATVTRNNFFGFLRINTVQPNAEVPDTHSTTSEFSRTVKVE